TPRMKRRTFDRVAQELTQLVPLVTGQPVGRPLRPFEMCGHTGVELGADASRKSVEACRVGRHHGDLRLQKVNRTASCSWRGGKACSNSPYVTRPCPSRCGSSGYAPLPKMLFTSLKFERLNRLKASARTSISARPRTVNRLLTRTSTVACLGIVSLLRPTLLAGSGGARRCSLCRTPPPSPSPFRSAPASGVNGRPEAAVTI